MTTPILLFLACAAHDPPMRPYAELPPAPARASALQSEDEIVRDIRTVYRAFGLPIDQVVVYLDAPGLLQMATDAEIYAPRWILPAASVRARWSALGQELWGAPLRVDGWTDEALIDAWNAWNTAGLAREMATGLGAVLHLPERETGPGAEALRARDVEMPVLIRLAERGRVPATWPGAYVRALEAVLAQAPPGISASIPADPTARAALLDVGLREALAGVGASDPEVSAASWLVLSHSLDRARAPLPLAELPSRFASDDQSAQHVGNAMARLRGDGGAELRVATGLSRLHRADRREDVEIRYDEERDVATVALVVPVAWPSAREPDLLRLINEANTTLVKGHFSLRPGELRLSSDEQQILDAAGLVNTVDSLERQGRPWIDGWLGMVERDLALKDALAAAMAARAAQVAP